MAKKQRKIDTFEWDMLVGAWRYYENRSTISAAMFPEDIVKKYFAGDEYAESEKAMIARQFAEVDHGLRGVKDWEDEGDGGKWKPEYHSWLKFYAFCKGYCNGFTELTVLDAKAGKKVKVKAFHLETTDEWYPAKDYVSAPQFNIRIDPKSIAAEPAPAK